MGVDEGNLVPPVEVQTDIMIISNNLTKLETGRKTALSLVAERHAHAMAYPDA